VKYVLDTHVWFWALEAPEEIPGRVRAELEDPANAPFGLPAVSLWELAKLAQKGRIRLTMPLREWMDRAVHPDLIEVIPLSRDVAVESTCLPDAFHSDPADELIVATARLQRAALITADKKILAYRHVQTLWA
jgi:PIN domain nuclease of toxin-antitoxin system